MKKNRKGMLVIIGMIILLSILGLIEYRGIIFQEGNPIYLGYAIIKLNLTESDLVRIPKTQNKYIMKSKLRDEPFIKYKEQQGWDFTERLGAGLVFEKDGKKGIATSTMFIKKYKVVKDFK